jgi:hypothetical protein
MLGEDMNRVVIAFLLTASVAQAGPDTRPAAGEAPPLPHDIVEKYDRFEDTTTVFFDVDDAAHLVFGFTYQGTDRRKAIGKCTVFGVPGEAGRAGRIIFLVDGDRFPLECRESDNDQNFATVPLDFVHSLTVAKKVEVAVRAGNIRSELALSDQKMSSLRRFIDLAGFNDPDQVAIRARKKAEILAAQAKADAMRRENENAMRIMSPSGDVIYILDTSGSMINAMVKAKAVVAASIASLNGNASFGILAAGEDVVSFDPHLRKSNPDINKPVEMFLESIDPSGTDGGIVPALSHGIALHATTIVFVTDGSWTFLPEEFAVVARKANVPVNILLVTDEEAPSKEAAAAAEQVARSTGGGLLWVTPHNTQVRFTPTTRPATNPAVDIK